MLSDDALERILAGIPRLTVAVLELTKGRRVVPEQDGPYEDVVLSLTPVVVQA